MRRERIQNIKWKRLFKEQKDLFDEYYLWNGGCFAPQLERAYANGLRMGFRLATEIADFESEEW